MEEGMKDLIGKHVHIRLKNNYIYSGYVNLVTKKYILLTDKFYKPVYIIIDDISTIEEYREKEDAS